MLSLLSAPISKFPGSDTFAGYWDVKQPSASAIRCDLERADWLSTCSPHQTLRGFSGPNSQPSAGEPSSIADACENEGRAAPEAHLRRAAGARRRACRSRGGRRINLARLTRARSLQVDACSSLFP